MYPRQARRGQNLYFPIHIANKSQALLRHQQKKGSEENLHSPEVLEVRSSYQGACPAAGRYLQGTFG